jgi:hypothetical protein
MVESAVPKKKETPFNNSREEIYVGNKIRETKKQKRLPHIESCTKKNMTIDKEITCRKQQFERHKKKQKRLPYTLLQNFE